MERVAMEKENKGRWGTGAGDRKVVGRSAVRWRRRGVRGRGRARGGVGGGAGRRGNERRGDGVWGRRRVAVAASRASRRRRCPRDATRPIRAADASATAWSEHAVEQTQ